jgi:hypothetical protein
MECNRHPRQILPGLHNAQDLTFAQSGRCFRFSVVSAGFSRSYEFAQKQTDTMFRLNGKRSNKKRDVEAV